MVKLEERAGKSQASPTVHGETTGKYLMSFFWMILLTAIAFTLVGMNALPPSLMIPAILFLAALQVILQLFTFMHLDLKWYLSAAVFMGGACIVAATAIVAMVFWV
ncbi:cytochrome C oxidase subunit IV family protein [Melghirimyces algeriensis]|uniref:Cytochrome c oxidase subunit 4 n=1 Tax=Melghirimyces algeriensis TaxID=910412 RepID=A0A521DHH9_9BACL|nr:cytochrome C oxidase subunit IV family protein [Melghirimyces algeriensis]SMO70591.1 cytochrome c oxidase subunit 4 [Melghirimyces algeriensis]